MAEKSDSFNLREIRRKKILENSDLRMKKIMGLNKKVDQPPITSEKHKITKDEPPISLSNTLDKQTYNEAEQFATQPESHYSPENISIASLEPKSTTTLNAPREHEHSTSHKSNCFPTKRTWTSTDSSEINGSLNQRVTPDYIFPKKVSDAETRSFNRNKVDPFRHSICASHFRETFQISSEYIPLLRPWMIILLALLVHISSLQCLSQSILVPFIVVEGGFILYPKFLCSQGWTRGHGTSSLLGSFLIMFTSCSPALVALVSSSLKLAQETVQDLALYLFSFILFSMFFSSSPPILN